MSRFASRYMLLVAASAVCACPGSSPSTSEGTGGSSAVAATGGRPGSGGSVVATGGSGSGGVSVAGSGGVSGSGGSGVVPRDGGATGGRSATGGGPGSGGATNSGGDRGAAPDGGGTASGGGGGAAIDPGSDGDGDFTVGPTYTVSPDLVAKGAPVGRAFDFTMSSQTSLLYKGTDATLLAVNQHSFTRAVRVYIPARYKAGTPAPFLVVNDGTSWYPDIKVALDNLSQPTNPARQLPPFVIVAVANGGGDSKGSERGLEYDTMSDRFARFVETEVLPAVLGNAAIKAAYPMLTFTADPDGRAVMGCSSGGAAALTMGWFRPDLFRRIVTYSGTLVDQQDDDAPEEIMYPFGAWEYHSGLSLIANTAPKPLRIFINANQNDNGATAPEAGHHNWLLANQRTAMALKAKNYHYRFVYGAGAGHCDRQVQDATMADTLLWVWRGYPLQ